MALNPGKARRSAAFLPQPLDLKLIPRGSGDLQEDSPGVANDLAGHVENPSPQGGDLADEGHYRLTHIFLLETLVKKKGHQHRVVKSGIGRKALEGEHFASEVFQGPVHQLIGSPLVVALQDSRGFQLPL